VVVSGAARRLASGINGLIVAVGGVVALGLVTAIADQRRVRLDLTADRAATLSTELRTQLERIRADGRPLHLVAFSSQARDAEAAVRDRFARDLVRQLEQSGAAQTQFVDFDADRRTAESLGVDRYGTWVITLGDDRVDLAERDLFRHAGTRETRALQFLGESAVSGALSRLLTPRAPVLYALTGHGERRLDPRGGGDLPGLAAEVAQHGWEVRPLDLVRGSGAVGAPTVPDDADVVLSLGAQVALTPSEDAALLGFLARGGALAVFVDPGRPTPSCLARFGVMVGDGVVQDTRQIYPFDDRPWLDVAAHPLTAAITRDALAVVLASAAPVRPVEVPGVRYSPLLRTGRTGWVERGQERPATFDPPSDAAGPVDVAAAVQGGGPTGGRLVVVGDADVLTDAVLADGPGNPAFVMDALRWLIDADASAAPVGRVGRLRQIALTGAQLATLRLVLAVGWPLVPLGVAAALHLWRRSR